MSDRLAVMRDGVGSSSSAPPEAVYAAPETAYVAGFLGSANVLAVDVWALEPGRQGAQRAGWARLPLRAVGTLADAGARKVVVRPERISLQPVEDDRAGRGGAQLVPRPGRPGRLPRTGHPRRGPARRRADPAGGGAQHRRADVVAVRRRPRGARDLPAGGGPTARRRRRGRRRHRGAARPAGVSERAVPPERLSPPYGAVARRRRGPWPRRPSRSRTHAPASTTGSSSATWIDSPSSRAENVMPNASASTDRPISPAAWPSRTTCAIVSRQRWSSSMRSFVDLGVPEGLRPQVEPQPPGTGDLALALRYAGRAHQHLEPLPRGAQPLELGGDVGVERLLGEPQRLGEQLVLGAEVVDDQRRAGARAPRDVGDAGLGEAPLADELGRCVQHLLAAQVGWRGLAAHSHSCSLDSWPDHPRRPLSGRLALPRLNSQSTSSAMTADRRSSSRR